MVYEIPKPTKEKPHQCMLCIFFTIELTVKDCELQIKEVRDMYKIHKCRGFKPI